ncbi:nitroreductase family protein [Actinomycetospora termitidis]|uniref:Nitroreductase family protein n=1 Tax=Actinomycetospora termitidis TaxID=3053470 RepID=A0ABT7MF54_9PSEU|nr:nitroreductase family protein [Actinomycetospora sp. Odt1-22]MDL5159071.1 nitroreductase family protein [Actinomycetospora sp. Odt1-22]
MELDEAMRTTGTCRYFRDDPVPDEVLHAAVDAARFGPQGGNRQPVKWIVVRDAARKQALADLYLPMWEAYFAGIGEGTVQANALPKTVLDADHFARHLASVPAILVLCAETSGLHPTDTELGRLSVVGGASIYPTMQNLCLALRDRGVATAVTTLLCAVEPQVRELLGVPDDHITAAHVAVGYPAKAFPTKLSRTPVEQIVFDETFGRPLFAGTPA